MKSTIDNRQSAIPRSLMVAVLMALLTGGARAAVPMGVAPAALSQAESLQAVIDRGGPLVYVPKGNYVLDVPLRLRSNLMLTFEPGTTVGAAAGAFQGVYDCLVVIAGCENVNIAAEGVTFHMRKSDYIDAAKYVSSEFRHCVDIRGSKNVTITGGTYADSGGDGIYLGPLVTDDPAWANSKRHIPNELVVIRRVHCDNNVRQGISVVAAKGRLPDASGLGGYYGVTIEDSLLTRTAGKSPQAGIDVEPEYQDPIDVVIRRCRSEGNRGPAYMWSLQNVSLNYRANNATVNTPPVRIVMEDCTYSGVPIDQPTLRMTGIFKADAPTGYLCDNIPRGSVMAWGDLVWKK